jgi:hypothetical protein
VIKTPEDAVAASTCALARISTFKTSAGHGEGCTFCPTSPRDLCRMVAEFVASPSNSAAIRLHETRASNSAMTDMWR